MPAAHSRATQDALVALGLEIARARSERRWTIGELAERAGITRDTVRNVEKGAPTVAIGTVFELAMLVGVPLLGVDDGDYSALVSRNRDRLAVLPSRVRPPSTEPFDDF
ncbi:MAG: helix-turn-helix transcriptional regulator [Acidimicrobiia bacterium]|nr:helix-turn-helix transcriptional regulator [Acidimicrobiia bacterium]